MTQLERAGVLEIAKLRVQVKELEATNAKLINDATEAAEHAGWQEERIKELVLESSRLINNENPNWCVKPRVEEDNDKAAYLFLLEAGTQLKSRIAELKSLIAQKDEALEHLGNRFEVLSRLKNDMFWEAELRVDRGIIERARALTPDSCRKK